MIRVDFRNPITKLFNHLLTPVFEDDFLTPSTEAGEVGGLGWSVLGSTPSILDSEGDHPGIVRSTTNNASSGTTARLALGRVDVANINRQLWVVRFASSVNSVAMTIGLTLGTSPGIENTNGAYFSFNVQGGSNLRAVTRNNSGMTVTPLSYIPLIGSWMELVMIFSPIGSPNKIEFYINGQLSAIHTNNIATQTTLNSIINIENQEASAHSIDIDYFYMSMNGFDRRYD